MNYEISNGINLSPDSCAILLLTSSGLITQWDISAQQIFGFNRSDITGKKFTEWLVAPADRLHLATAFDQLPSGAGNVLLNKVIGVVAVNSKGKEFPAEMIFLPAQDGYYLHIRAVKRPADQDSDFKPSDKLYRQLMFKNPYPMWLFNPETLAFLQVNDSAIKKYGYSREEFLQMTLKDIRSSEDIPRTVNTVHSIVADSGIRQTIWKHIKKNGELIYAEVTTFPVLYENTVLILAQVCDITETMHLRRELAYQHKMRQKQLTEAIFRGIENEKEAIGKELHDNINQVLATAKLYLDVVLEEQRMDRDLVQLSREQILNAIQEIRNLSRTFIAPDVQEHNLFHSIEKLIHNIRRAKKIHIDFRTEDLQEEDFSPDHKITIYRIIQEQLNNILKYSGASFVRILLHKVHYKIELLVEDDGRGFDTSLPREGIGITNIISRAAVYNGKVYIDSAAGKGCRLNVVFHPKLQQA